MQNMHPPHSRKAAQALLVGSGFLGTSCVLIEVFKSPGHISHFVFVLFGFPQMRSCEPPFTGSMWIYFRFLPLLPQLLAFKVCSLHATTCFMSSEGRVISSDDERCHAVAPGHWVRSTLKITILQWIWDSF